MLSDGKDYIAPEDETYGENDADSGKYSLDFKLVESSSYFEANRQFSDNIEILFPSGKAVGQSKKRGSTLVTNLHCALREVKTFEQIEDILKANVRHIPMDIRTNENIEEQIKVDLKTYFNVLRKNKNLLLFIPKIFILDKKEYELLETIDMIKIALSTDFLLSMEYRKIALEYRDTFLVCIYDKYFLIFMYEEGKLAIKNIVPYTDSQTFVELYNEYGTQY